MNSKLAATFVALGFATVAFAQQPGQQSPSQSPRQSAPEQRSSPGSQPPGSSQQMSFENVDKNKDGKISRDEASAVPGLNFAEADADDNDSLDQREYTLVIARLQPTPRG
jgi:hypothetical protein